MGRNRKGEAGSAAGEAQVHNPDDLRPSLGDEQEDTGQVEEGRDYRAEADKYGITNADNYTDEALAELVSIRENAYRVEEERRQRIEAVKQSFSGAVVEPDEVTTAPGAAAVEDNDGGDDEGPQGGEG